jgi:hypothetical protein
MRRRRYLETIAGAERDRTIETFRSRSRAIVDLNFASGSHQACIPRRRFALRHRGMTIALGWCARFQFSSSRYARPAALLWGGVGVGGARRVNPLLGGPLF